MRRTSDPFELIKLANPVPDPDRMPDEPESASAQALVEEIIGMTTAGSRTRTKRSRRAVLIAAALLVLGATAAGAVALREGNLPDPPFSGDTWKLTVGEGANDELGTVFKVCHTFERAENANMANGYGTAGCIVWPSDSPTDSIIIDVVPAVETPDGVVLFVDLTDEPVDLVSVVLADGSTVDVAPYVMPQSGKQYAAVELAGATTTATVQLLDDQGNVLESRTITDLTVAR